MKKSINTNDLETTQKDLHRALNYMDTLMYHFDSTNLDPEGFTNTVKSFLGEYGFNGYATKYCKECGKPYQRSIPIIEYIRPGKDN
ncbi:MAG: hypothetical protein V3U02_12620 [Calditrichia bacterium]